MDGESTANQAAFNKEGDVGVGDDGGQATTVLCHSHVLVSRPSRIKKSASFSEIQKSQLWTHAGLQMGLSKRLRQKFIQEKQK